MIGLLPTNKDGTIDYTQLKAATYQPSKEVADLTKKIRDDYAIGMNIMNRAFEEFNDLSLIERMNEDQKAFNNYVQPKSDDPTQRWRWNGIRPITRSKLLSIAAHVIALMLYPEVAAQNDQDEMDKKAAEIMRYLIEWLTRNSDYEVSFLYAVVAALVNPVAYLGADYIEAMQTIRKKNEKGEITYEEMLDEVVSGFQIANIPADEILITNPYEYYLQRQRAIMRRRWIDWDEAKSIYGEHEDFIHIKPGIKYFYNEGTSMFYEQNYEEMGTLCEEVIYYNRRDDLEVPYVNGVYLGKSDTADNPIRHRDCRGAPKYNLVKFGYHPIDEKRFYFYKSAAFEASHDQKLADRIWRLFIDGTWLQVMSPLAIIGGKRMGNNVWYPGATVNLPKDAKAEALGSAKDLGSAINALKLTEESLNSTLVSKTMEGQVGDEKRTLGEIAMAEKNARISLGIFGLMVKTAVKEFGELMIDIIINKLTVAHIEETAGGDALMKYRTFLLPNQTEDGKTVTRKIRFDESLIGKRLSPKEKRQESLKVINAQKGYGRDTDEKIVNVNPVLFRKKKFLVFVEPTTLLPKNEVFQEILKLGRYDRAVQSPHTNHEQLARDLLIEPWAHGQTDKYMLSKKEFLENMMASQPSPAKGTIPETETPQAGNFASMLQRSAV